MTSYSGFISVIKQTAFLFIPEPISFKELSFCELRTANWELITELTAFSIPL